MTETQQLYAGQVNAEVADALQLAASACADPARAEALLLDAHRSAPDALPVYFALYKFYFYRGRLAEAEHFTRAGLAMAAASGGFVDDWQTLTPATADWLRVNTPQHFYLFSLKALAFIRLRQGDMTTCAQLLRTLARLDVQDTVGAAVIRALLQQAGTDASAAQRNVAASPTHPLSL